MGRRLYKKVVRYMNTLSFIADLITIILFLVPILNYIYNCIISNKIINFIKKISILLEQYYNCFKCTKY